MPELPEVQALAAFVASRARGRTIAAAEMLSFAALKTATPPVSALLGREIEGAGRRGKFLLIETVQRPGTSPGAAGDAPGTGDAGRRPGNGGATAAGPRLPPASGPVDPDDRLWLIVHFARAGWLRWREAPAERDAPAGQAPARASGGAATSPDLRAVPRRASLRPSVRGGPIAMRVTLDDGSGFDLTEMGTQKRLAVYVTRSPESVEGIARLGIDPFDPTFDLNALRSLLAGRTAQLKHLIADQSVIAGVGNAYSDEALHAAGLSPFRPAGRLTDEELGRLYDGLTGVLAEALARNEGVPASELKDEKRSAMRVHGRTGLPCPTCGDTIREVAFADRSLQYCPTCQTGGKPLADRRLSRLLK